LLRPSWLWHHARSQAEAMDAGSKPHAEFQFRHSIRLPTQAWPHKKYSTNSSAKHRVEVLDGICSQVGDETNQLKKNER
jgi:hypothetical protein